MNDLNSREAIIDVVRKLEEKGFNHVSTGNVSCRTKGGILITPTGGNSSNITPDRIVLIDDTDAVVGGGVPSSEWHMHVSILRAYPVANAVIHTHADFCVALSCLHRPLPAFHYMVAGFGGDDVATASSDRQHDVCRHEG